MNAAISNAERVVKAEQQRTSRFEKDLADAAEQLRALRAAYDDASEKAHILQTQLDAANKQCESLEKKLICSTCMDREKNVSFACGHAYCEQCAADWGTCTTNCKRPDSDKPVKFRYPLYL